MERFATTPSPVAESSPPPIPQWYYCPDEGEPMGPFPTSHLRSWIQSGELPASLLVWRQGMENWVPSNELPDFSAKQPGAPPPLPPSVPLKENPHLLEALDEPKPDPSSFELVGRGPRGFACMIDLLIVCVPNLLFIGGLVVSNVDFKMTQQDIFQLLDREKIPILIFESLVCFLYEYLFLFYYGATPGKMCFKLKVVSSDYTHLDDRAILIRTALKVATIQTRQYSRYVFYVLLLPFLFSERKQFLHDSFAGTLVVRKRH